jgi:capsular polysaccharide biosynthesis protein
VDFWDITKLLVRRWMIVLPMLVISATLAVVTMKQVKPDYVATAYVQLVPPVNGDSRPGQPTVDQRNPWIGLGLQTIGNAAIVQVTDLSVVDDLQAAGYSDSYTVTMAQSSPLITFEIVGTSPHQSQVTAEQLIERFNKSLTTLQTAYGVTTADLITGRRLDVGTNVKESSSKVKRALVAVAGAGLLVTIAVTVGVDAWLRRRQRRGQDALAPRDEPAWPGSTPRSAGAGVNGDHRTRNTMAAGGAGMSGAGMGGAGMGGAGMGGAGMSGAGIKDGGLANVNLEQVQPLSRHALDSLDGTEAGREVEPAMSIPSDATIVLPLPAVSGRSRWIGRREKK